MELRHLRYFVAVAEVLHFSRAAERLHLTQPALSRQIRDLEQEIGVQLLERHGTATRLTTAGSEFLVRARELLAAAERAIEDARASSQVVRFGHYGTLWIDHFGPALRRFVKAHPHVSLQPVELTPVELAAGLREGTVDFALLGPISPAVLREFATRDLGTMQAMLAMSAENPLAKRRRYALHELRDARWIAWDEHAFPGRRALLEEAAAAAGFTPRIIGSVDSLASLLVRVGTSRAVGYVLPISKRLPHAGVVFVALREPGIRFEMHVAWRRSDARSPLLAQLARGLADA